MQELDLMDYVANNPNNTDREIVRKKVYLLNRFYSTRVPREEMVDHILKIDNIDIRLRNGDPNLVLEIAKIDKTYYSFASKFCSMHQPAKFPIFDSLVWSFFEYLGKCGFFSSKTYNLFKTVKVCPNGYTNYITIYDEFLLKSNIKLFYGTYRKVDAYIWSYFQVYIIYHRHMKEADGIFPNIFTGVASCAIWEIIKYLIS